MKTKNLLLLLILSFIIISCNDNKMENEPLVNNGSEEAVNMEEFLSQIDFSEYQNKGCLVWDDNELAQTRAIITEHTYYGYNSEYYYNTNVQIFKFGEICRTVGLVPGYYYCHFIRVEKVIDIPPGVTPVVLATPGAGYIPGTTITEGDGARGITSVVKGSKFYMSTCVYAVRGSTAGSVPTNCYMPKIHINSNNLQEMPWRVAFIYN